MELEDREAPSRLGKKNVPSSGIQPAPVSDVGRMVLPRRGVRNDNPVGTTVEGGYGTGRVGGGHSTPSRDLSPRVGRASPERARRHTGDCRSERGPACVRLPIV